MILFMIALDGHVSLGMLAQDEYSRLLTEWQLSRTVTIFPHFLFLP